MGSQRPQPRENRRKRSPNGGPDLGGLRFSPPAVRLSDSTRWVLLAAFAPPGAAPSAATDPQHLLARAERLFLTARIACRHAAPDGLEGLLGAAGAAPFVAARRAAAARDAQLEALTAEVARAAAALEVPLALLKYAGLRAAGALAAGGRLASDVDVLARPADAPMLRDALLDRGFGTTGLPAWEHHLAGLAHPRLGAVEIHVRLPGLAVPGRPPAAPVTLDDLAARDVLGPARWPAGDLAGPTVTVPSRPVLLAHALVHALVQHGWAPGSYPPWRGVSDWIDLGLGGPEGEELLAAAGPWLGSALRPAEADAARQLAALLVAGRPEALTGGESGAALGRHLLAGVLDPHYRRSLRLGRLRPAAGAGPGTGGEGFRKSRGRLGTVRRALVPPRAELAALYGPWRSRWGLIGRRLVRPVDLVLRAVAAAESHLLGRWRRPPEV